MRWLHNILIFHSTLAQFTIKRIPVYSKYYICVKPNNTVWVSEIELSIFLNHTVYKIYKIIIQYIDKNLQFHLGALKVRKAIISLYLTFSVYSRLSIFAT